MSSALTPSGSSTRLDDEDSSMHETQPLLPAESRRRHAAYPAEDIDTPDNGKDVVDAEQRIVRTCRPPPVVLRAAPIRKS